MAATVRTWPRVAALGSWPDARSLARQSERMSGGACVRVRAADQSRGRHVCCAYRAVAAHVEGCVCGCPFPGDGFLGSERHWQPSHPTLLHTRSETTSLRPTGFRSDLSGGAQHRVACSTF